MTYEKLTPEQRTFVHGLRAAVEHAVAVRDAADEYQVQRIIDEGERHKVQVLFGPPGTGKTAVVFLVIEEVLERGGYVLFAVYTAELASRVRQRFAQHPRRRQITIDTCHAAFALHEDFAPMPGLQNYQLIVVDEVSQLTADQNDRLLKLRDAVDEVPAMAEMGDRWQMSGFGERRAWDTVLWRQATHKTELHAPHRCKDEAFWRILNSIRTARPEGEAWTRIQRDFLRYNKAWHPHHEPTVADVRKILNKYPHTTFLACTRKGANLLDDLCTQAMFPKREPLAVLEGDIDSWAENYHDDGSPKPLRQQRPRPVPIHKGMPLYITRNCRKDVDFVNGMLCWVIDVNVARRTVTVETATGKILPIGPEVDENKEGKVYYPLRHGFASTVMKKQGAELPHVTLYLDAPNVKAAAYTGMSRVKYMRNCLIGGHVTPRHFRPAA